MFLQNSWIDAGSSIKNIGGYVIAHELLYFNFPDYYKLWKNFMLA